MTNSCLAFFTYFGPCSCVMWPCRSHRYWHGSARSLARRSGDGCRHAALTRSRAWRGPGRQHVRAACDRIASSIAGACALLPTHGAVPRSLAMRGPAHEVAAATGRRSRMLASALLIGSSSNHLDSDISAR